MANFEGFCWNFLSSTNSEIVKSVSVYYIGRSYTTSQPVSQSKLQKLLRISIWKSSAHFLKVIQSIFMSHIKVSAQFKRMAGIAIAGRETKLG